MASSFHVDASSGALGDVLRDSANGFMAVACGDKQQVLDVLSLEVEAVLVGLLLSEEWASTSLWWRGDSLEIV